MLPKIVEEKLADYVDIFCENGYFTVDDTKRLLKAANVPNNNYTWGYGDSLDRERVRDIILELPQFSWSH